MPPEHPFRPKPSIPFVCLPHLLEHQARRIPDAPAVFADGRVPLTYARLYQHIETTGRNLRAMGIGRHDRIAVVLPNGAELAAAILAVAANAACAPVNPAFGTRELDGYFADLRPRAVVTVAGEHSPAALTARSRGIPVIELSPALDAEAGLFTLVGDEAHSAPDEPATADHTAMLLPTSGTTGRSKIVPQKHAGMCTSAYAHVAALALTETDRCLNVLPLFHGHGLHATLIASLAAGASIVCTPGLDASRFSEWLAAFQPTWYSAVPTIHQAILARARQAGERLAEHRLRFVRSSSASLAPSVFSELERTFESPVIEWYGMTEVTSSPIACNPLPPQLRKAGSVGVPRVLHVAIMDEGGALRSSGQTGEIVVRGASVTKGYDGNPQATEAAFAGDWFKTGDLGYFDDEGYLFLVGRVREMINRGGEKIAPQEVDEVLLEHPAVAEAVTFAVPHATLGEDVASAIVLRPNAAATSKDIRQFASRRIAEFKVPRQVFIMGQIPKGPTGKVQRIGLAALLGLIGNTDLSRDTAAPRTLLENTLAEIWAEVLELDQVGIHDDFFAMGGDSLRATRLLIRLYEITEVQVEVTCIFEAPTVAQMAEHIETVLRTSRTLGPSFAIQPMPRHDGTAPASAAQERLCKLQHALPDLPIFNILYALRTAQAVDAAILERSINEIVRRHEILRTTFDAVSGRYVQIIGPQLTVPLLFDDLCTSSGSTKERIAHRLIQEEVLHSFDLAKGPLIRPRLLRLADQEYLLLISLHQVVCDGWSLGVLVHELTTLYDAFSMGKESPLSSLSIQYADFAHFQRRWRSHPDMVTQLEYWRGQLHDAVPLGQSASPPSRRGIAHLRTARREMALSAKLSEAAKRFAYQEGSTLFMVLVAALKILMHCHLGTDDTRVATNVANRNRPGTEALIGPLVNTLILRTNLGGGPTCREVLRRVRATTLAAFAHQDLAFQDLVETIGGQHNRKEMAMADVMLLLHNAALREIVSSGRRIAFEEANPNMPLPLVTMTSFNVIIEIREGADGLVGTCVYKPHLFSAAGVDQFLSDFRVAVEYMTAGPQRPISGMRRRKQKLNRYVYPSSLRQ